MELYQLEYFLEIARTRNFTRAAERLFIAQPALSEQIRRLEEELGAKLFDRGRRESVLTAAGKVLAERAEGLLAQAESIRRAVQDIVGLRAGRLVVGSIPSVSACLLPGVIADFRALHPFVELVLLEGTTEQVSEWVDSGRVELGIVQLPVPSDRGDRLVSGELLKERFVVLVSSKHPFAGRPSVSVRELSIESFVFYKGRARDSALSACRDAGFEPKTVCETGELDTVRSLVSAGLGVAILPELAARHGGLGCLCMPIRKPALTRTLAVVRPRNRERSPAAEVFSRLLEGAVSGVLQ